MLNSLIIVWALVATCRVIEEMKTKIPDTEKYIEETRQQLDEVTQAEQELGGKVTV